MVQARGGNDGRIDCRERPQELSNHMRNRIWKMKDPKSRVIMPSWACAHCGCLSPLYNVSQAETEWHFWLDWSMTRASWATYGKACEAAKMETRRASICCDQDSGQFCVRHLLVTVSTLIGSDCEPYHLRAATENSLSEVQPDLKGSRPQQAVSLLSLILSPQTKRRRCWEVLYWRQMKRESRTDKQWKPTVDKASMNTVFVIKEAYCFIEEEGETWGCHREWFGWH